MGQALIVLVVFVMLTLGAAALALLVRDLIGGKSAAAESPVTIVQLRNLPATSGQPRGLVNSIDARMIDWLQDAGLELSLATCGLLLLLFALLFGGAAYVLSEDPMTTAVGIIIGMSVVFIALMIRRTRRLRELQRLLPDVFDLLARAVRAGQSVEQAIETAGRQAPEPLGLEFRRCSRQIEMGLAVPDVVRQLAQRVRVLEMSIFALVIGVHRQTGGNLTVTLERLASVIRDRIASYQQLRAATGAGRFSAVMISCVGPLLFLYMFLFQFDYARRLVAEPTGQILLLVAVLLEVVGIIWILRMLRRG
jgi:tight adherence protein B